MNEKSLIKDFKENDLIHSFFLVTQKSLLTSKTGRPYLSLKLSDCSGDLEGRVWDQVDLLSSKFEKGDFIQAKGKLIVYNEKSQLNIVEIEKISDEKIDLSRFLPVSEKNIEQMTQEFFQFIEAEITNPWIIHFLKVLFSKEEIIQKFKKSPAAKTHHHAWLGGLLEHVLQLLKLSKDVLKHYPMLSKDLVYAGLILHDLGKIFEMSYERGFSYTDEGQLVGHLIQGVELIYDTIREIPNFPSKIKTHLVHLVLAHHGKLEYGSPKLPMTLEALMVHYLDDLDSKIQGVLDLAKKDDKNNHWVEYNRLFLRPMYRSSLPDMKG